MRLLRTDELKLKSFPNPKHPDDGTPFRLDTRTGQPDKPPEYAVLSHRWSGGEEDEVTYAELLTGVTRNCAGWFKIIESCKIAKARGIDWIWIDTCCIDKRSLTELAENLNLMYTYYARAKECYAYLEDVGWKPKGVGNRLTMQGPMGEMPSEWFTRGWTLQELLAPGTPCRSNDQTSGTTPSSSSMIFFDQNWKEIGHKADAELSAEISRHSRIKLDYIRKPGTHREASIAMRLSWAATRSTTKLEDRVYSLLGLFDLTMPILYGEGETAALMRLQLELIARSDDQSIFAWVRRPSNRSGEAAPCGMLATSLDDFEDSNDIVSFPVKDKERPLYSMTKEGLEFRVFNGGRMMTNVTGRSNNNQETIMLPCSKSRDGEPHVDRRNVVKIDLRKVDGSLRRVSSGTWNVSKKFDVPTDKAWLNPGLRRVFYVKQN